MYLPSLFLGLDFGLQFLTSMLEFHISVYTRFTQQLLIQRHYFLRCEEPDLHLIELWSDLRWLYEILLSWVRIILDSNLLVAASRNSNTNLEESSDLSKIFAFRVAHDNPFMHEGVLIFEIDVA